MDTAVFVSYSINAGFNYIPYITLIYVIIWTRHAYIHTYGDKLFGSDCSAVYVLDEYMFKFKH